MTSSSDTSASLARPTTAPNSIQPRSLVRSFGTGASGGDGGGLLSKMRHLVTDALGGGGGGGPDKAPQAAAPQVDTPDVLPEPGLAPQLGQEIPVPPPSEVAEPEPKTQKGPSQVIAIYFYMILASAALLE